MLRRRILRGLHEAARVHYDLTARVWQAVEGRIATIIAGSD